MWVFAASKNWALVLSGFAATALWDFLSSASCVGVCRHVRFNGDAAKAGGGPPKIGYNNHMHHHPFRSQFKVGNVQLFYGFLKISHHHYAKTRESKSVKLNLQHQQQQHQNDHLSPFKLSKLLDHDASWDKDQLGDVLHWIRQALALVCGFLWGLIPLVGSFWFILFVVFSSVIIYGYYALVLKIDEDEFCFFKKDYLPQYPSFCCPILAAIAESNAIDTVQTSGSAEQASQFAPSETPQPISYSSETAVIILQRQHETV